MIVYRITKSRHAADISGIGASLYPGRWNKKGTPVLYTGESKEIALLETLVHAQAFTKPKLNLLTISIPGDSITELSLDDLPSNWFHYPAPTILSEIGQDWINEQKTLALKVPSCIIHSSYNYILNCTHPDYAEAKVTDNSPFHFDRRLLKT